MKKLIVFAAFSVFSTLGQLPTDTIVHIPIGEKSLPLDGEIQLELVARKQHYKQTPENIADVFDRSISSPKSAVFTPDGSKFYVHSLEGFRTSVYETGSWKRVKVIHHNFGPRNNHLFKGDSISVFDYKYREEREEGTYNHFAGKPVESCLSHDGKYLWVTYYRRNYDKNAESPSAVAIIDTEKDEIVRVMPTGPLPKMIACSPDNRFVAVTHWGDNTVGIIDVSGDDPMEFEYIEHCVVDRRAVLDFDTDKLVDRDNNCGNCLRGTIFSPDSRFLLVGKMGGSGGIMIFDTQDWSSLGTVRGMEANLRHMVIHKENLYISTNRTGFVQKCNWKDMVKYRVENEGKVVYFKKWESASVGPGARTIDISGDGNYVFSAVNNACQVKAVRTSDMKVVAEISADSYPVGMALSPDEKYLVVTSQGKRDKGGNSVMIFSVTQK